MLSDDAHPDAHSCRLKLSNEMHDVGMDSRVTSPWSMGAELRCCLPVRHHVSSACRLTIAEEQCVLAATPANQLTLALRSRREYLVALGTRDQRV